MGSNTDKEHRGGGSVDPGISVCDSTCGRNGREQTRPFDLDCLRSTSKQVKLVGCVLKALGLSPHSKMFKKKKKIKKSTTGDRLAWLFPPL